MVTADMPYEDTIFIPGSQSRRTSRTHRYFVGGGSDQTHRGLFRAGEHLCVTEATVGEAGRLSFKMPDGSAATASNWLGRFQPDTSDNGCGGIASVQSTENPHGIWAQLKKDFGINVTGNPVVAWLVTLMVSIISLTYLARWKRKFDNRPGTPISAVRAEQSYPGFALSTGDFEVRGNKTFRVNSDGRRIDLKNWHFSQQTGEFHRITQRVKGHVLHDALTYDERFVNYAQYGCMGRVGAWFFAAIAGTMAAGFFALGFRWWETSTFSLVISLIGGVPLAILTALMVIAALNHNWNAVGPEPLKRTAVDLSGQQPHGSQDDDGTI